MSQQALLAAIVNSSEDAIVSKDLEGIVTSWNKAAERIYGWKAEEIIGRSKALVIPSDLPEELPYILGQIKAGRAIEQYQTRRIRKNGELIDVAISVSPVKDEEGTIVGAATIVRDITNQHRLEMQQARLAAIVDSSEDAIVSKDLNGIVTSWNRAAERIYGWKAEEIIGKSKALVIPPDMPYELAEILTRIRDGDPVTHYETRRLRKDGVIIDVAVSVSPVRDIHGNVIGGATIARDITESKRIQRELEARQAEIEVLNERLTKAMQETHHRVKNNLQVVGAIIDMQSIEHQSSQTVPISELTRLGSHIRALALVHDFLTKKIGQHEHEQFLSSGAMLEELIGLLQGSVGNRSIKAEIDDVKLLSKQAVTVSLVLNELVSNAVKHGKGLIEVSFKALGDRAELTVCDDGKGFPEGFDALAESHTGLELVMGMTQADLRGDILFENSEECGGRVRVSFPLPATTSSADTTNTNRVTEGK